MQYLSFHSICGNLIQAYIHVYLVHLGNNCNYVCVLVIKYKILAIPVMPLYEDLGLNTF